MLSSNLPLRGMGVIVWELEVRFFHQEFRQKKRTYFFNVKENRRGDLFMNIVESTKHGENGFERHSIMVYEEDMENFVEEFTKAADYIRKNT